MVAKIVVAPKVLIVDNIVVRFIDTVFVSCSRKTDFLVATIETTNFKKSQTHDGDE